MSGLTLLGDGWIEGIPEGEHGPIEIVTIGTITDPASVPQVRRWYRPITPLPTRPGYYLVARPPYGETVIVELLASPRGQWVDAGDTRYLTEGDVRELLPLRRLVPLDDVIRYFRREAGPDAAPDDWRLRAARTIEAEWETE